MPITCEFKDLPLNHGNQIIEMWVVCRDDGETVEIAEHPDGAMKAYAAKSQADDAAMDLWGSDKTWRVETIWLLHKGWSDIPAEALRANAIRRELRKSSPLDDPNW